MCRRADILNKGCIAAMGEVGLLVRRGRDVCARDAHRRSRHAVRHEYPQAVPGPRARSSSRVRSSWAPCRVTCTTLVENLVGMMMEGAGFEIATPGHRLVKPEDFVEAVTRARAGTSTSASSALLTTTMPAA